MKTRTNQPIYKDDGTLLTDTDLGGGSGGSIHYYRINCTGAGISFMYISDKDFSDKLGFLTDLKDKSTSANLNYQVNKPYYVGTTFYIIGSIWYIDDNTIGYSRATAGSSSTQQSSGAIEVTKVF